MLRTIILALLTFITLTVSGQQVETETKVKTTTETTTKTAVNIDSIVNAKVKEAIGKTKDSKESKEPNESVKETVDYLDKAYYAGRKGRDLRINEGFTKDQIKAMYEAHAEGVADSEKYNGETPSPFFTFIKVVVVVIVIVFGLLIVFVN